MIKKQYKTIFACILSGFFLMNSSLLVYAGESNTNEVQQSATKTVSGVVKDQNGEPLIGATITVKGTSKAVVTDIDGNFSISCSNSDVLAITYLGFTAQEIAVGNKTNMPIVLVEDSKVLDELIVIGYGTTTRKSVVGAVDQVKSKILEDRPAANMTQALQGASPSLVIQQTSMDPNNNNLNINIRGLSTMNNNAPLIVIDGLVSDDASLNKLNPNDIENVSILKDAGTAAIYGSRSSNGVILVTTKTGKKNQRPMVRLNGQIGAQDPKILFRPVTGYQNATLKNLSLTNTGQAPQYSPSQIQDLYAHQNEEYWYYDKILQTGLQQQYNVNVSGGSDNTTYMFSAGYFDQQSNYVGPDFGITRYNVRSNITSEYGRFKLTSILGYTRDDGRKSVDGNAIINSSRIPPYYWNKLQDENGRYLVNDLLTDQNPLAGLEKSGSELGNNDYINVNLALEVKIIDGLKLKGVLGADIFDYHRFIRRIKVPMYKEGAQDPIAYMNPTGGTEDYNENKRLMNYQLLADYQKTFNKDHNLSVLLGASNESYTFKSNELKYGATDPLGLSVDPLKVTGTSSLGRQKTSITSLFGRVGYNFKDRYYAELSFREDGSSIFAEDNRWGFFPSGTLGWRISEEKFMDSYREKVGDLKIRSSYGVLGNQRVPLYQTFTTYESFPNSYAFNNIPVVGSGYKYGNVDMKWETSHSFNVGVDANFLKGALTATLDYFHKTTKDILLDPEVPTVFGGGLQNYNMGEMKNQGWEINLNYHLDTKEFKHSFTANLGDSWNKVTKFTGFEEIIPTDEVSRLIRVGLPYSVYYGYKRDGYFTSMDEIASSALPVGIAASDLRPGDAKYNDRNGDGVIDSKDRYVLGNAFPRYTFGFTYDVSWKNFDFSMFWQGVGKRDMMVRGELVEPFHSSYSYVIYQHQLDYWTPTNTDATWPRLAAIGSTSNRNNYGMGSTVNILDGKYARLKNIQIGYTLPKELVHKMGLGSVRAYINGQNLLTFSKNSWIDPESSEFNSNMSGGANSARNYPSLRYYGFGFDIEF